MGLAPQQVISLSSLLVYTMVHSNSLSCGHSPAAVRWLTADNCNSLFKCLQPTTSDRAVMVPCSTLWNQPTSSAAEAGPLHPVLAPHLSSPGMTSPTTCSGSSSQALLSGLPSYLAWENIIDSGTKDQYYPICFCPKLHFRILSWEVSDNL